MFETRANEFYHQSAERIPRYNNKFLVLENIMYHLKKEKLIKLPVIVIHEVYNMTFNQFARLIHSYISKLIEITVRAPYVEIKDKR